MNLFIESSGGSKAPGPEVASGVDSAREEREETVTYAHQRAFSFHDQEVREMGRRGIKTQEAVDFQSEYHQQAMMAHMSEVVARGAAEWIPAEAESSAAEPATSRVRVPELALPQLATAV